MVTWQPSAGKLLVRLQQDGLADPLVGEAFDSEGDLKMKKTVEFDGMTVADLICELEACNPDAKVLFVCDYGDHHHTQQALPVNEINTVPMSALVESAYSQSRIAYVEDDEEEWTSPTCPKCGAICVDEEGELADSIPDDAYPVVVLKQH